MIIVASISKLQRRRHGVDVGVSTFLDCMACTVQMRPISTEWRGPLGCLCVGHDREPTKTVEANEMPFGARLA